MTRLLPAVWCGVAGCALACSSETSLRPPPAPVDWQSFNRTQLARSESMPSATERERAVADAYAAALSSLPAAGGGDFTRLGALLDDDAHFTFAGFRDVHGRGNVIKSHEALFGAFGERRFTNQRVLMADDSQVVEWSMTGTHRASGKSVVIRGLTILWTKDDGSLTDLHVYFDENRTNAQLGTGPKALQRLPPPELPSGPLQRFEAAKSQDEQRNVAVVRDAFDALENGAEARYLGAMTDDVTLSTLESSEPFRGKAGLHDHFKALRQAIAELDIQIDDSWGVGPFVVVEYHVVGEQRGPIGFVPPEKSGIGVIKMFTVDVAEMRDGKIAQIWRYDDPALLSSSPEKDLK